MGSGDRKKGGRKKTRIKEVTSFILKREVWASESREMVLLAKTRLWALTGKLHEHRAPEIRNPIRSQWP